MKAQKWVSFIAPLSFALVAPALAGAQEPEDLPAPPNGYDQQGGAPQGDVTTISYQTTGHGTQAARVYTPPGYAAGETYPTL
jgi:enterochelin esterase-like enzyme